MHSFARLANADFALFVCRENIRQAPAWTLYVREGVTRATVAGGRSSHSGNRSTEEPLAQVAAHGHGRLNWRKKKASRRGKGRIARRNAEREARRLAEERAEERRLAALLDAERVARELAEAKRRTEGFHDWIGEDEYYELYPNRRSQRRNSSTPEMVCRSCGCLFFVQKADRFGRLKFPCRGPARQ